MSHDPRGIFWVRSPAVPCFSDRGSLHSRIATALGWSLSDAQGMSLHALRDLVRPVSANVRPVSAKLAHEITIAMSTVTR